MQEEPNKDDALLTPPEVDTGGGKGAEASWGSVRRQHMDNGVHACVAGVARNERR